MNALQISTWNDKKYPQIKTSHNDTKYFKIQNYNDILTIVCLYDLLYCDTGLPRFIQTSFQSKRGAYKVSNMEWDFTYEPYEPYVKMYA